MVALRITKSAVCACKESAAKRAIQRMKHSMACTIEGMSASGLALPLDGIERQSWKLWIGWTAAILTAVLFLVAGLWKLTDPMGAAVRMAQAKLPESLSLVGAIGLGTCETLAGVLVLMPRYRRWGAILASALLLFFMMYIGYFYRDLQGQECSCFPWVKRAVGPAFFIGDAVMLALAALAGIWASRPQGLRTPLIVLAAVAVFAAGSYTVAANSNWGRSHRQR